MCWGGGGEEGGGGGACPLLVLGSSSLPFPPSILLSLLPLIILLLEELFCGLKSIRDKQGKKRGCIPPLPSKSLLLLQKLRVVESW